MYCLFKFLTYQNLEETDWFDRKHEQSAPWHNTPVHIWIIQEESVARKWSSEWMQPNLQLLELKVDFVKVCLRGSCDEETCDVHTEQKKKNRSASFLPGRLSRVQQPVTVRAQLSTLDTLGACPSWSSATMSPLLFLRPFILRVCSLDRSCFCMCTRPNLVPKASWEMFFFFLTCRKKDNRDELFSSEAHFDESPQRSLSTVSLWRKRLKGFGERWPRQKSGSPGDHVIITCCLEWFHSSIHFKTEDFFWKLEDVFWRFGPYGVVIPILETS